MRYVELMDAMQFELAAEYLLMAAMLAEIKSRMLLPRSTTSGRGGGGPPSQLIRRLQEYERFKKAAEDIEALPRLERDTGWHAIEPPELKRERPLPDLDMKELLLGIRRGAQRADMFESHQFKGESLSTRERMSDVLERCGRKICAFCRVIYRRRGSTGGGGDVLALMELIKEVLGGNCADRGFWPDSCKGENENNVGDGAWYKFLRELNGGGRALVIKALESIVR